MVRDMSEGKPAWVLVRFALPMVLGNLFQQMYNIVDSMIVGNFVGAVALGAVGASAAIVFLFVAIAIGGSIGASVVIGQLFGAKQYGRMKTAISTSVWTMLVLAVVFSTLGLVGNRWMLTVLNTPAEVMPEALDYLSIYFYGLPFLFFYNIMNAVFNALGDSKTPLIFLIFSSLLNVGMDLWFVIRLEMGVAGVAWATLIAQGIAAVCSALTLWRRIRRMRISEPFSHFDWPCLKKIGSVALPTVLQQSIVSLGMVSIQSVVNSFGTVVLAGYTAANKIDSVAIMPMVNVGNAMSSFTAQNIGAKKPERIHQGYKGALVLSGSLALLITGLIFGWGDRFINGFLDSGTNTESIAFGLSYLRVVSLFYILFGLMNIHNGVLKGAGDMRVFMACTLINFGCRVATVFLLADVWGPAVLWWSSPIGWGAGLAIATVRYYTGGWKKKRLV